MTSFPHSFAAVGSYTQVFSETPDSDSYFKLYVSGSYTGLSLSVAGQLSGGVTWYPVCLEQLYPASPTLLCGTTVSPANGSNIVFTPQARGGMIPAGAGDPLQGGTAGVRPLSGGYGGYRTVGAGCVQLGMFNMLQVSVLALLSGVVNLELVSAGNVAPDFSR